MSKAGRGALLVLLWLVLASASPMLAQCSKRIVIYLDASGSMEPQNRTLTSAFHQSLEAVRRLLDARNFLGSEDVVEIVLFGERPQAPRVARGRAEVAAILDQLGRGKDQEPDTNLGNIFQDIDRLMTEDATFARQVIVLASDFVNEPRDLKKNGADLESWKTSFSRWGGPIREHLDKNEKLDLLLFLAPPNPGKPKQGQQKQVTATGELPEELQGQALKDLVPTLVSQDRVLQVGRGGNPELLAKEIQRRLTAPPVVEARLAARDKKLIDIEVSNPNCFSLSLKSLSLRCTPLKGGKASDEVPITLEKAKKSLAPIGTEGASQTFTTSRPTGPCWDDSEDFEAVAETEEGATGKSGGTTATTVVMKPTLANIEESFPFPYLLRLDIDLKGQYNGARPFQIQLAKGERVIAKGSFLAPKNLEPENLKHYRMNFPLSNGKVEGLFEGEPLDVRLTSGRGSQAEKAPIKKDDLRSRTNTLVNCSSVLALLIFAAQFLFKKISTVSVPRPGDTASILGFVSTALITLVPAINTGFRVLLLQKFSFQVLDNVKLASSVVAMFFASYFLMRMYQRSRVQEEVYSLKESDRFDVDRYVKRSLSGARNTWLVSLLVAGATFIVVVAVSLHSPTGTDSNGVMTIPLTDLE